MTFKVGMTGGIASGKSTAATYFAEQGIQIIDADLIARDIVRPASSCLSKIITYFGNHLLQKDGSLNRKKLREIIFACPEKKAWLENLLHPIIRAEIKDQLSKSLTLYSLLVSPLLFETDQYLLVDRVIVIDTTEAQQIKRTAKN